MQSKASIALHSPLLKWNKESRHFDRLPMKFMLFPLNLLKNVDDVDKSDWYFTVYIGFG